MFLSVPEPVFPKSRANWIYLESKSHPGLSVLRLEAGQGRVDAASLPSVCPAWEPGLPVVRTLGSVKQDPVKVQPKDFWDALEISGPAAHAAFSQTVKQEPLPQAVPVRLQGTKGEEALQRETKLKVLQTRASLMISAL